MSSTPQSEHVYLPHLNVQRLANLCGVLHENIILLEKSLQLSIRINQNQLTLYTHSPSSLLRAKVIINELYRLAEQPISPDIVQSLLTIKETEPTMSSINSIKLSRKVILPRNSKQAEYLTSIDKNDIIFAVGPAGTGKTYLAVSKAIECFEKGEVQRLVFVRPAVEAGEKLGFLPGDLVEKVLPYLRPIYDAIYEMLGFKEAQKLIQNEIIEILPLAFMRGRTLNDAFIILDEAQNTTIMQMKMFLTRMGFGSKTVVTGDMTQVDLPKGTQSGLSHAVNLFKDLNEISIHRFTSREVVRHPLISRIVDSYDREIGGENE
ncbi:phosphate starvation-inducible protein PhoH [Legionella beliardensis]|uniref:PhoH-like protein n=1 Tax=Legionella beliardensis TaxID=91822 RepID=A0A378I1F4_9GAMM|nr:PhoH family protein [Legionella beliardensis]STX28782.1 phosphate starvation-inducible protein PhoH [Legionella beliardensis]